MADASPVTQSDSVNDPWSGRSYGNIAWILFSSLLHLGLLFAFATITLTVISKPKKIDVQVIEQSFIDQNEEGGEASLEALAGVLHMERRAPKEAMPSGPKIGTVRAPQMPRVASAGPKLGAGPKLDSGAVSLPFSHGGQGSGQGAGVGGLSGKFGEYVGALRKVGLDVAIVIDTTDSMQFVIDDVKAKLTQLVTTIQRMVPTSRVGIVVYRDEGDDYVVKWSDLSFHTHKLKAFLSEIDAAGGGDWEEAVREALETTVHDLKWRKKSKRVIILVGGSPPHEYEEDQVKSLAARFHQNGGSVNAIDVTQQQHYRFDLQMWRAIHGMKTYKPSPLPDYYKEVAISFGEIVRKGGGELIRLDQEKVLVRELLRLTFGTRWKREMARFMDELS